MDLNTTSSFLQHENSLKTHEKISILPGDVQEIHGVLSDFSIIGDLHNDMKKNLREKHQQENQVLFRHVPKKVLDVFAVGAAAAAVYNHPSLEWILRVRLPSKGEGHQGRSGLTLDLESPASQISSSLSECSPFASEISGDSLSLLGEAEEKEDMSPDSGCNIITQPSHTLETSTSFPEQSTERATAQLDSKFGGSPSFAGEAEETEDRSPDSGCNITTQLSTTSIQESLTSFPEQSTEGATAQLDSKLPDSGEEKKKEVEEEKTGDGKSPSPHTGSFYEEDTEFEYLEATNFRRCSSVKAPSSSGADSPGTKKEVRFADALGLDLESVKHIARGPTDPPAVPPESLRDPSATDQPEERGVTADPTPKLRPCFAQPGSSGSFPKRTHDQKVLLESVSLNDLELSVSGSVCVVNISYVKRVFVRYTITGWLDFNDLDAIYSGPANEGRLDKFHFKVNLPKSFVFGSRLEFAVCYESKSQVYWDNNFEANYHVECR